MNHNIKYSIQRKAIFYLYILKIHNRTDLIPTEINTITSLSDDQNLQ